MRLFTDAWLRALLNLFDSNTPNAIPTLPNTAQTIVRQRGKGLGAPVMI